MVENVFHVFFLYTIAKHPYLILGEFSLSPTRSNHMRTLFSDLTITQHRPPQSIYREYDKHKAQKSLFCYVIEIEIIRKVHILQIHIRNNIN